MSPTALDDPRTGTVRAGASVPGALRAELLRRRSRRRTLLRAAVAAAVVGLLVAAAGVVRWSSAFAAREVEVSGQRELTAVQVRDAAAVPLGVPLVRQDLDAIARRAAALPEVASVRVTRDWPATVAVQVTERRPLLAVPQPDGFLLVDDQGVAYRTSANIPGGVLRVDADPTATPLLGELGVVAAALPEDLREDVTWLRARSTGDITLELDSGATVAWGDAGQSVLKAQIVSALLTSKTKTIDVSAPHTPAVR